MRVPRFIVGEGFYDGGIITPNGFEYYYSDTIPDDFVGMVDLSTPLTGSSRIGFASKVLDGAVYEDGDVMLHTPFPVVKYSSMDNAKKMANNAVGYPCKVLSLLGGGYVKLLDNGAFLYELYGDYYYCSALGINITQDAVGYHEYLPACLLKKKTTLTFTVKDGKVYLGTKLVVPSLTYEGFRDGDPKYLLSYENMFQILCEISKLKRKQTV